MTLRQIIYDIREKMNLHVDDTDITNEYLAYLIGNERNKFVQQLTSRMNRDIPAVYKQNILLSLELIRDELDREVVRSVEKVPNILNSKLLDSVTSIQGNVSIIRRFTMVDYKRLPYVGTSDHLKRLVYGAVADDSKLYLNSGEKNFKLLNEVRLRGIFSDVEQAWKLSVDYDQSINFFDIEYPIEPSMVPDLVDSIIKQLVVRYNIPEDKVNDAEETT